MNTFGARLRAARNTAGLTQERLGGAVGVSKAAISRWESDQDQPQFAALEPLRKALRVSLDELICGDGHKRRVHGIAEEHEPYDRPDDEEWEILKAIRRMTEVQRRGLIAFLDIDSLR